MPKELSIIIPIYNEIENINRLFKSLKTFLESTEIPCEVIFVEDGSQDGSLDEILKICKENTNFKTLALGKNYGLSTALKAGFIESDSKYVAYLDADLQTDPMDFHRLLPHRYSYDLVNGIRGKRQDTWAKKMTSKSANFFRQLFLDDKTKDSSCPLKIMNRKAVLELPLFDGFHRFIPALLQMNHKTFFEVEVSHYPRIAGKSKFNFSNRCLVSMFDLCLILALKKRRIHYHPKK